MVYLASHNEARIVGVRSMNHGKIDARGNRRPQLRKQGRDPVNRLNDIGPRLPEQDHHNGRLAVDESRIAHVLDRILHVGHVRNSDRGADLIGNDQGPVLIGFVTVDRWS